MFMRTNPSCVPGFVGSLLLFASLGVAGVQAADEAVVTIDAVDRTVKIITDGDIFADSSSDPDLEEWAGHADFSHPRYGSVAATQSFSISEDEIDGVMMASSTLKRRLREASSLLEVTFTVSHPDYESPDSTWGWDGDSPLEALYGGRSGLVSMPACRLVLDAELRYEGVSRSAFFPMIDSEEGVSEYGHYADRGAMGFSLTRKGEVLERHMLELHRSHDAVEVHRSADLVPGVYVLSVECGLFSDPRRPDTAVLGDVFMHLGISFETLELGSLEPLSSRVSGRWDQMNGASYGSWEARSDHDPIATPDSSPFPDQKWIQHTERSNRGVVDGGAVYEVAPTNLSGFLFARTVQYSGAADHHDTSSMVDMDIDFELESTTDVGIAALSAFRNELSSLNYNEGICLIAVRDNATGALVYQEFLQADDSAADGRQFVESHDWVTLPAGSYRLEASNISISRDASDDDSGNENGFWFGLAFERP